MIRGTSGDFVITVEGDTTTLQRRDGGPVVAYPYKVIEAAYDLQRSNDTSKETPTTAAT